MKNRILLLSCITTLFLSCKSTNNLSHEHTSNNSYSNLLTDELVFILTYGKSKDEDLKVGVKNANNKILIEDKFENISKFYGNYANVVSNSNFGYINSNGRVKEFPEYDKVYWYTSNTGIVIKDCKYGLINRKGKLIQPLIYDNIHLPNQGFFIARKEKESILIKENGKVIHFDKLKLEGEYVLGSLVIYSDSVKVDGTFKLKKGLANLEQEIIIKAQFDEILNYKNNKGLFEVENNNKYGLVNLDGEVIIPIEYDAIDIDFNNDIISAQKNRKWGFIDVKNNIIIPFEYKLIRNFHEGLAVVKVEGKLAFINIKNEIVIKPKFKYYYSSGFYEGLSLVRSDEGKFGYIDKQGNIIIETIYDYATKFNNGFSVVGLDNLYGLINREGVVVLPIKHTSLIDYENTNYKFTE